MFRCLYVCSIKKEMCPEGLKIIETLLVVYIDSIIDKVMEVFI